MHPDQVRTFLAVTRDLSYTRAAKSLHLSQSAVWRRIRQLEEELGVRLIEQFGKTLHLTDAGRILAHEGEALLGHLGRVLESMHEHTKGDHGRLRIGASSTPGYFLLPRAMGRLHREHPELELHYEIANSSRVEQQILRNELDIGFVGGPIQSEELAAERLATDRIVCVAAEDHPLARKRQVRPEELVREICVTREPGSATREMFEAWLMGNRLRLERTLEVASPQAGLTLVAAGLGFSIVPRLALRARVARIAELAVTGLRITRPITAAWHRSKHFRSPMKRLLEFARAACDEEGRDAD
jgi:DNA-binding transcriptional LysR family regulator